MAATFVKASTNMGNRKRAPVHCSLYEAHRTRDAKHINAGSIVTMKEKFSQPKAILFSYVLQTYQQEQVETPLGCAMLFNIKLPT